MMRKQPNNNSTSYMETIFSYTQVHRRRMLVEVAPSGIMQTLETIGKGARINKETLIKSKILSHFIKEEISRLPIDTILMILRELEHLENLMTLARCQRNSETTDNQISMISASPTIRKICINKTHRSKTLHLLVEINNYVVEGLVDIGASMFVMVATIVRKLGIVHLVTWSETYKTMSRVVTQAMGRIDEVLVKVGGVQCAMTFMVVDTDSYDILLGLDFLIKIGAIVDVEQGLIQVRHGPRTNVEVLPLTMVNMLQNMSLEAMMRDVTVTLENTQITDGVDPINKTPYQHNSIIYRRVDDYVLESNTNTNNNEHCDEIFH
jgi:predicted aspartyl protease